MTGKSISLKIPKELYDYIEKRALDEHRTISNMIVTIIQIEKQQRYINACMENFNRKCDEWNEKN